jgi:hypothetical protein
VLRHTMNGWTTRSPARMFSYLLTARSCESVSDMFYWHRLRHVRLLSLIWDSLGFDAGRRNIPLNKASR